MEMLPPPKHGYKEMYADVQNHQLVFAGKGSPIILFPIATLAQFADMPGNAAPGGEFGPTLS